MGHGFELPHLDRTINVTRTHGADFPGSGAAVPQRLQYRGNDRPAVRQGTIEKTIVDGLNWGVVRGVGFALPESPDGLQSVISGWRDQFFAGSPFPNGFDSADSLIDDSP